MKNSFRINEHSYETDLYSGRGMPYYVKPKPKKKVVYCTSYACTRPENLSRTSRRSGPQYDKFRVIENPPADGWCEYCSNALLTCYEVIK